MFRTALRKAAFYLIVLMGLVFPIYYAIFFQQQIHHKIILWRIALISLANLLMLAFLLSKSVFLLKEDNIKDYLDQRYTEDERKRMIRNYWEYKLLKLPPLFRRDAISKDEHIRDYQKISAKKIACFVSGFTIYCLFLATIMYILI